MRQVSNEFKQALVSNGRELDCLIIYTNNESTTTLTSEDINSVNYSYRGSILKSVMRELIIDSNYDIPLSSILEYRIGVKVGDSYEYISYSHFIVKKSEKQQDTESYLITCYDGMVNAMTDYVDLGITYPITIRNYINAICSHLGLVFKNANSTFTNYDQRIPNELYLDSDGNSMYYTFRDVLDELAEVTASIICINETDGELEIRYPNVILEQVTNDNLKDINVVVGKKYGPVNRITLSRSADTDQLSKSDDSSIEQNGLTEIKIVDNQILNETNRQSYLDNIYSKLNGLNYRIVDLPLWGSLQFDIADRILLTATDADGTYHNYYTYTLNNEITQTQDLTQTIFTEEPLDKADEGYSDLTKAERDDNRATLIINKQEAKIEAKVSKGEVMGEMQLEIDDATNESIIRFHSNKFILEADNASIDEYGNASFNDAILTGGNLTLQDDGTQENSAMKIETKTQYFDDLATSIDLSNKKLKFNLKDYTYEDLLLINNEELIVTEYTENNETTTYFIYLYTYTEEITNEKYLEVNIQEVDVRIPNTTLRIKLVDNKVPNDFEIDLYEHFGVITELLDNTIIDDIKIITYEVERETSYSGNGIETDILPNYAYDINDVMEVADKIDQPGYVFTKEEVERWDVNGDGIVDSEDLLLIQDYTIYNITPTSPGHLKLDTQTIDYNFKLTDGNNRLRFAYGFNGLNINGHKLYVDSDGFLFLDNVSIVYFQPGDYTFNTLCAAGLVTSSTQEIIFSFPVGKSMANINSISIVSGAITIRGTSGYVENSGTSPYFSLTNTNSYTYSVNSPEEGNIRFSITKKSGTYSNVTNNTPVVVYLRNVKLRFA